jgi:transposase InsO family protein
VPGANSVLKVFKIDYKMDEEKYRIPLFDGKNYDDWKFRMEVFLDEKDVLIHVQETLREVMRPHEILDTDTPAVKRTKEEKLKQLERENKKCKSYIIQRIQDNQLEIVKGKSTAREVWKALEDRFLRVNATSRINLVKKLQLCIYNPFQERFEDFCVKFDRIIRDLRQAGESRDDESVVIQFLLSMPVEYESVVTALRTVATSKLTLECVRQHIEEFENDRTTKKKKNNAILTTAFTGYQQGLGNYNSRGYSTRLGCYNCGMTNHKVAECFKPGGGAQRGGANSRGSKSVHLRSFDRGEHHGGRGGRNQQTGNPSQRDQGRGPWNLRGRNYNNYGRRKTDVHQVSVPEDTEPPVYSFHISVGANYIDKEGTSNSDKNVWLLGTGATDHLVRADTRAVNVRVLSNPVKIHIAKSKEFLEAKRIGDVKGVTYVNGKPIILEFKNVLLVDNLKFNLLSISKLEDKKCKMIIEKGNFAIWYNNTKIAEGVRHGKLYKLQYEVGLEVEECHSVRVEQLWHERMGHISVDGLKQLQNSVDGMDCIHKFEHRICDICVEGKQVSVSHSQTRERATRILERIHSDVFGPINPTGYNGVRYLLTVVDDFSHFTVAYGLKNKSEVGQYLKEYVAMATARFSVEICQFRCDNGREYVNDEVITFFREKGIQWELNIPYTSAQNGVAERMNRTIKDKTRCMLRGSNLRKTFWIEAALTAVYLINRSPTKAIGGNKVPAEVWYGTRPNLKKLRKFGCVAFVKKNKSDIGNKMESRSKKCILLGFCPNGYRLWSLSERKIISACDVVFDESRISFDGELGNEIMRVSEEEETGSNGVAGSGEDEPNTGERDSQEETGSSTDRNQTEMEETKLEVDRSGRNRKRPAYLDEYSTVVMTDEYEELISEERNCEEEFAMLTSMPDGGKTDDSPEYELVMSAIAYCEEVPESYEEIEMRQDREKWYQAIQEEISALKENETWTLVRLPPGKKVIKSKWVFTVKYNKEGKIERYKARLVAKGCSQKMGRDYSETYAPVAKLSTLRILLSVSNSKNLYVHQLDVRNAFLNGLLKEEIYLEAPEILNVEDNVVCKLQKTLYGLKQAPMEWNARFDSYVKSMGFRQCRTDRCLYVGNFDKVCVYLLLYVDDFIIATDSLETLKELKDGLMNEFKMRDLGELGYFFGDQH